MFHPDSFKVSTPTDHEIQVTRDFHAPRHLVFDAFTNPDLVRRWLLGPPGWTMPVCEIDLKVGGTYRYVWRKTGVADMGTGRVFREIVSPERVVATEKFDETWYPGDALDTTVFVAQGDIYHQSHDRDPFMSQRKPATRHAGRAWSTGWQLATTGLRNSCRRYWRKE